MTSSLLLLKRCFRVSSLDQSIEIYSARLQDLLYSTTCVVFAISLIIAINMLILITSIFHIFNVFMNIKICLSSFSKSQVFATLMCLIISFHRHFPELVHMIIIIEC